MATATQARQQEQMQQLLAGLSAVRGGDFSTRLPDGQDHPSPSIERGGLPVAARIHRGRW